jgi:Ca2+-binding RTX toxin-like protein
MKSQTDEPHDPPEPQEPPAPLPAPPSPSAGVTLVGTNEGDRLFGGSGINFIYGLDGDDLLVGRGGDDFLYGGAGNDFLDGGTGADRLDGGAGEHDWVRYYDSLASSGGVNVDLVLGRGSRGEAEGDTYFGIEHVHGSHYNDQLFGNAARNILVGDGGSDMLYGRAGDDTLVGGEGHDSLDGGAGSDSLDGGSGEDWVLYSASSTGVTVNLLTGFGAGGEAQDDIYFNIEDVDGSAFADVLIGNAGDNKLWGRGGDDQLFGGAGNDQLLGGAGNDALRGGAGADFLDGGAGTDTIYYQDSSAGVNVDLASESAGLGGDAAGDIYFGIENVVGSSHADHIVGTEGSNDLIGLGGNDWLTGGAGNDRLIGGDGDDELGGGAGADKLDGGNGSDLVSYGTSESGVTVNLATGVGSAGDAAGDTYFGIENVYGSIHDDVIIGNAGNNILTGGHGNDTLIGGAGQDTLRATGGHDIFTGDGSGIVAADTFVFGVSWNNRGSATITDFQQGVDKIDLVRVTHHGSNGHATLQDFGTDGELAWGFTDQNGLHANALDASDKYFFDTASHTLYECDFTSGTLVLGSAIVTIDAEAPRLQTSDFVLG